MHAEEFSGLDATAQAALVHRGEISARELVAASIARIEALNGALNAVIHPRFERALDESSAALPPGPLRGVPFLVKDLMCTTAGDPYHAGTHYLKSLGYRAPHDTFLAARYRRAGLVLVGRTNTPELGLVTTTEPLAHGPTRNPWATDRSTGGSSGGSAAAVAAGMVAAAHANDGGGSIRIPAAHCGLFGLKPSRGRISHGPARGDLWLGAVCEHVVTRSVRDSALLLDVSAGAHTGDPYAAPPSPLPYSTLAGRAPGALRIGFMQRTPGGQIPLDGACAAAVGRAARTLESLGHRVEPAYPSALDQLDERRAFMKVLSAWVAHDVDELVRVGGRPLREGDLEPANASVYARGKTLPAADYVAAQVYLQTWSRRIADWWDTGFDLLLTPTTACPPAPIGSALSTESDPLAPLRASLPYMAFTAPFNISGQPAASIPCGHTQDGLPVGIQLVAAYGREDLLLQVASQFEQALPWTGARPPAAR